jgi:hypothetical protein
VHTFHSMYTTLGVRRKNAINIIKTRHIRLFYYLEPIKKKVCFRMFYSIFLTVLRSSSYSEDKRPLLVDLYCDKRQRERPGF